LHTFITSVNVYSHIHCLGSLLLLDVLGVVSGISDAVQYHSASRAEPSTKRLIRIKDLS
jgi:hypothetical protein